MTFHVTVVYPQQDGGKFDMDYYMKTHMPLVGKHFGKHGLTAWHVCEYNRTPDGGKPPYIVEAKLEFKEEQNFHTASKEEGGVVFGDVPNFTNIKPILMVAEIKGSDTSL